MMSFLTDFAASDAIGLRLWSATSYANGSNASGAPANKNNVDDLGVDRTCFHPNDGSVSLDSLLRPHCNNVTSAIGGVGGSGGAVIPSMRPSQPQDCGDGPIPFPIAILGATLGSLILATGIFGNVLILASIWRYRPLRKTANAFVASLAVCDLFHTALVRPLYVYTYVVGRWQFGAAACVYALVASNLAILESILHVTTIAFHRYVALVHPRCAGCLQRRIFVGVLLCAIYVGPLAVVIGQSWPRLAAGVVLGRDVVFNRRIMFCSFVRHTEFRPASVVKKAAFVSLNAAFIAFCYVRIYRLVRTRGRRLSVHGTFNPVRLNRELTLLRTVVAVFVAFVVNYMPITVVYGADTTRTLPYAAYFVGVVLLWISPSANWIIYGLMNVQYARAYRHLLCRRRQRQGSGSGGSRWQAGGNYGGGGGTSASRRSTQIVWPPPHLVGYGRPASDSGLVLGSGATRHMSLWSAGGTTNGPTSDDVDLRQMTTHVAKNLSSQRMIAERYSIVE